ncbi:MAG TPA: peptide-methionine (S)-S-oxide reductase MsrA [Longimicrobiales bacterium]|nr:peptide-methionine (S)-S-oxide reductase MsrA [Longimicrobiales bacterium]
MSTAHATLGGGCFWCLEAVFERVDGVRSVTSGYAGGEAENPSYAAVCSGTTGHAEVVRLEYDPEVIEFRDLLDVFFATHDPTTPNRQGPDTGPQYRSIILYESESQRESAESVMRELEAEGVFGAPIVTELEPLEKFWPAEAAHQEYYRNNPNQPYCRVVIDPKVAKLRERFADRLRPGAG